MKNDFLGYVTNGIAVVFSALQSDQILSYISWGCTLIATGVTIAYTIWKWYKRAKEDGKITADEIDEGIEILKDGADRLKEIGEKGERKDG